MREWILMSELDWVPTELFQQTARLAYEVLLEMRTRPVGKAKMRSRKKLSK